MAIAHYKPLDAEAALAAARGLITIKPQKEKITQEKVQVIMQVKNWTAHKLIKFQWMLRVSVSSITKIYCMGVVASMEQGKGRETPLSNEQIAEIIKAAERGMSMRQLIKMARTSEFRILKLLQDANYPIRGYSCIKSEGKKEIEGRKRMQAAKTFWDKFVEGDTIGIKLVERKKERTGRGTIIQKTDKYLSVRVGTRTMTIKFADILAKEIIIKKLEATK